MSERSAATDSASGSALEEVVRRESGQILATLIRATGDFDLAEKALADAVAVAVARWPVDGVPANPGGWLTTTARRRAIDRIRRDRRFASKLTALGALYSQQEHEPVEETPPEERHDGTVGDDRLRLIFNLLPSRAFHRGARRADAADPGWPHHPGDRARVPRG